MGIIRLLAACTFALLLALPVGCAAPPPADTIFSGGSIYTVNPDQPRATEIAVRDGVIVAVGGDGSCRHLQGADTEVIDLGGATVFPGFTDAHMHLEGVGSRSMLLDLVGTTSRADLLRRLGGAVENSKPGEWIVGRGWIETFWKPAEFPTRQDLDTVARENPVILRRIDGHGAVCNTLALARAGITADTSDPFGGEILHDDAGEPTGMLLDNAQGLVQRLLPATTAERRRQALIAGAELYASRGWTGVHVAGTDANGLDIIEKLAIDGRLPLRVYATLFYDGPETPGLEALLGGDRITGRRFSMRGLKISFDGALGSRGAALLAPYDDAEGAGFLKHNDDELRVLFMRALRAGVQIQVHAIGDRANRKILDLFEGAFRAVRPRQRRVMKPRWRVEHAQVIAADDIPRFAALGVIPSMQPSHAISDLHFAPARIGIARLAGAYAWRDLIDSGAIIPAGSDAPVEVGDPRIEFYAAVARRDLKGFQGDGWYPHQAVSREEALKMLTLWPAIAAFQEEWRGTIEVGKVCDLTIFNDDLITIAEESIPHVRLRMTVIDGMIQRAGVER